MNTVTRNHDVSQLEQSINEGVAVPDRTLSGETMNAK